MSAYYSAICNIFIDFERKQLLEVVELEDIEKNLL